MPEPMDKRSFQREPDGTWSIGVDLENSGERAKLTLRRHSGAATESHLSAAMDVVRRWKDFQRALEPALFAFYCRTATDATESGPSIASPPEVWANVDLSEVEVFSDDDGNAEYVQGFGHCSWEREHGLEVVLRGNGELVYVGSYEGWQYGDLPADQEWNFANPSTRERAIAERPLSDSEFADYTADQPPEPEEPSLKTSGRPWWKLW